MTFDEACALLFKVEGFYSNHPLDSGGPTMYGITLESWAAYINKPVRIEDIKAITEQTAKPFYRDLFWYPLRLDLVNNPTLRYLIFDQAVNRGPVAIVKQIQTVL